MSRPFHFEDRRAIDVPTPSWKYTYWTVPPPNCVKMTLGNEERPGLKVESGGTYMAEEAEELEIQA